MVSWSAHKAAGKDHGEGCLSLEDMQVTFPCLEVPEASSLCTAGW